MDLKRVGQAMSTSAQSYRTLFSLKVSVCDQKISFQVYDQDTGDEYIQIHLEQLQGNFVGQVREACQESLARIRQACFKVEEFLYPPSQASHGLYLPTLSGND